MAKLNEEIRIWRQKELERVQQKEKEKEERLKAIQDKKDELKKKAVEERIRKQEVGSAGVPWKIAENRNDMLWRCS